MHKQIIVCCDGTWNRPRQLDRGKVAPSNVYKLAKALERADTKNDKIDQRVFYETGVGTGGFLDRIFGGATGSGIERNIKAGYEFIVDNYAEGDQIFLFGFSRGAYTARSIAGLIFRQGLIKVNPCKRQDEIFRVHDPRDCRWTELKRANYCLSCKDKELKLREVYRFFKDKGAEGELKRQCSNPEISEKPVYADVSIEMIGAWDTVGALGIPRVLLNPFTWFATWSIFWPLRKLKIISNHQFLDVSLNESVKNAYHALAIDELRQDFSPTLWVKPKESKSHLEQVWFSGVHTNIGGGYEDIGLSDITLDWMIQKARKHQLELDQDYLNKIMPDPFGELRNSRIGYSRIIYRKQVRKIDLGPEDVSIHWTVKERTNKCIIRYLPKNIPDRARWQDRQALAMNRVYSPYTISVRQKPTDFTNGVNQ